jgi:hypothetical protein
MWRMGIGSHRLVCAAALLSTVAGSVGAQLARSPGGGGGKRPGGGVEAIPRNPYAGAWTGWLALRESGTGVERSVAIGVSFAVADAATQTYSGETTIEGRAASAHLNFGTVDSRATARAASGAATPGVLRRSAETSSGSGPSEGAPRKPVPVDAEAFLVHHPVGPLLCDTSHRCADMPILKWEEKTASGSIWSYAARLVAADSISGTITQKDNGAERVVGAFALRRVRRE